MTISDRDKLINEIENQITQINTLLLEKFKTDFTYDIEYRDLHMYAVIYKVLCSEADDDNNITTDQSVQFRGNLKEAIMYLNCMRDALANVAYSGE